MSNLMQCINTVHRVCTDIRLGIKRLPVKPKLEAPDLGTQVPNLDTKLLVTFRSSQQEWTAINITRKRLLPQKYYIVDLD